jgi:hypothetical protein
VIQEWPLTNRRLELFRNPQPHQQRFFGRFLRRRFRLGFGFCSQSKSILFSLGWAGMRRGMEPD